MASRHFRVSILMYHQVGHFAPMKSHRATYCRLEQFVAQMQWLNYSHTPVISLDQCLRMLRGEEPAPARAVVLTFDDAYNDFADNALPVLKRYAFPATVYVPTAFIGGKAEWLAHDGLRPETLLSAERLRALAQEPLVTIGAHGVNHLRLAEIPLTEAKHEIERSRAEIERLLDRQIRHFCYPFGSVDPQVMGLVAAAGFATATTCQRGAVTSGADPMGLPRKGISFGDNPLGYVWKVYFKHALKGEPLRRTADHNGEQRPSSSVSK